MKKLLLTAAIMTLAIGMSSEDASAGGCGGGGYGYGYGYCEPHVVCAPVRCVPVVYFKWAYKVIDTFTYQTQPYEVCVTVYDHCGRPHQVVQTHYRTVKIPTQQVVRYRVYCNEVGTPIQVSPQGVPVTQPATVGPPTVQPQAPATRAAQPDSPPKINPPPGGNCSLVSTPPTASAPAIAAPIAGSAPSNTAIPASSIIPAVPTGSNAPGAVVNFSPLAR